ncbi:MAG: hypothetical protein KAI66_17840 [Lentisphaeria bacterium]|nr:hypothetical protein [Lentisphaeria bacterium]
MLQYDTIEKTFQFTSGSMILPPWRILLEIDGVTLDSGTAKCLALPDEGSDIHLTFPAEQLKLHLAIRPHGPDMTELASTLENTGDAPRKIGRVFLLACEKGIELGEEESTVVLPLPGVITQRAVYRVAADECPRESKIKALFHNRQSGFSLLAGFSTFARADTVVIHDADKAGNLTTLHACCDYAGWVLEPGKATELETLFLAAGTDPYALLEAWADLARNSCARRQWEDVPIGWLGWSWVDAFNVENYEETMLRNCRAIRDRLPGHSIQYVWLSIGNLAGGTPGNWLEWNYKNFPSGPHALAAKLAELGFRLGLWCGPFYICSAMEQLVEELGEALLKRDGETMVVAPEWRYGDHGHLPREKRPCVYALDPSHPRAQSFIHKVFKTYRDWGVRYYMIDFLDAGAGSLGPHVYDAHFDSSLVAGPEAYRAFLQTIRDACGDDTYLLSSSGPMVHNAGLVEAIRTGNDFGEGRQITPQSFFYPASFVINGAGFWTGPGYALRNQACAYYTHRKLYINDSGNVLTVDSPLALESARIHATIHTFGASPAMFGDDIERMAADRLEILRKTLPRPHEIAKPLDLFETPYPDHPKLFHRRVVTPWSIYHVLAVYNFSEDELRLPVQWSQLDESADTSMAIWEFWNQQYLGLCEGGFEAVVPPGSVRVYRLAADLDRPELLGTDMHLTMGEMEVVDCAWDERTLTLSGQALRPSGEIGCVFFRAPAGLAVQNPQGLWIAKDARDNCLIIKKRLDFTTEKTGWNITFQPV